MRPGRPFLGREALERQARGPLARAARGGPSRRPGAVLVGRETILRDGAPASHLASGGFGRTVGTALGCGSVRDLGGLSEEALLAAAFEVVVAGRAVPAGVSLGPFRDPEGARVKS